jgi:putative FmdB family regulatory protein
MPDYDYECGECGRVFILHESLEEHGKGKRVTCPACGSKRVERTITSVYVTTAKKT